MISGQLNWVKPNFEEIFQRRRRVVDRGNVTFPGANSHFSVASPPLPLQ
jgi:hypothetical protein